MPFPPPSLALPTLTDYALSYRGLNFGGIVPETGYQIVSMPKGLEPPDTLTGDVQRALDEGEWIGVDLYPGRDIEILQIVTGYGEGVDRNRQLLAGALGVGGTTEDPLFLQLPTGLYVAYARPRKHAAPLDVNQIVGGGFQATSLLHADDPRWYRAPSHEAFTHLPQGSGGMTFPAIFPIDFGGTGSGTLTVVNEGTVEMRPILIVEGPVTDPMIYNASLPNAPFLGFGMTLLPEDQLVIGLDYQTAVYYPAGSTEGASRRNTTLKGSTWWYLQPGENEIEFRAREGGEAAKLKVQWADAFAGL
jgi:hypothetical protein